MERVFGTYPWRLGWRLSDEQAKRWGCPGNCFACGPSVGRRPAANAKLHGLPEMVRVPGGRFQMGGNDVDSRAAGKPVHSVDIGKYDVTQGQWRAIMGSNPSFYSDCGSPCPVERVSRDDVQLYFKKLNLKTVQKYRRPSETEWESACLAGHYQGYFGSDDIDSVAWFQENSPRTTHPVGQLALNRFGLHDMSGNVSERLEVGRHPNYTGTPNDGSAWVKRGVNLKLMMRGGSWAYVAGSATHRTYDPLGSREEATGLRLAGTTP